MSGLWGFRPLHFGEPLANGLSHPRPLQTASANWLTTPVFPGNLTVCLDPDHFRPLPYFPLAGSGLLNALPKGEHSSP
jgi:hypothetical protein